MNACTEIRNTGIRIPQIIFGTSALGNLYKVLSDEVKQTIVGESVRQLNTTPVVFDCAGKYGAGLALESLGKCLREEEVATSEVLISNKLGWLRVPLTTAEPQFEKGVWKEIRNDAVQDISYEGILRCWEQGLQLLGGRYTPRMISVHDPDEYLDAASTPMERRTRMKDILEAYRALQDIKRQEEDSMAIGIGAKNWHVIKEISEQVDLDWVMLANSLTIFSHPPDLLKFIGNLINRNIIIINSAIFHAGFLVGSDYFDYRFVDPHKPENLKLLHWRERFFKICEEFHVESSHACIRFGNSHPGIAALALNTSNPDRIAKNIYEINTPVPVEFFTALKKNGLIDESYEFV